MATWTAGTALGTGAPISQAWVQNVVNAQKFLAANDATYGKDLCQMRRTTSQTGMASATWTAISFEAEDFDVANGHSTSTTTNRYTAQAAGKYRLTAAITLSFTSGSVSINGLFRLNGSGFNNTGAIAGSWASMKTGTTTQATLVLPTTYVSLTAGQWVDVVIFTDASAPVPDPSAGAVQMAVEWVGAP